MICMIVNHIDYNILNKSNHRSALPLALARTLKFQLSTLNFVRQIPVYRLVCQTIFAFLTLNTPRSGHKEIFGAKFLSFERAAITYLRTVNYADMERCVQ